MSQPISLKSFAVMSGAEREEFMRVNRVTGRAPLLGEQRVSPVVELSAPSAKAQTPLLGRTSQPVRGKLNGTEQRYAKRLEERKRVGEVVVYWYEAIKFRLADGSWFTPDFFVVLASGQCELHECKGGFTREAALVRLKVTSDLYWSFPVRLVREKPRGIFTVTEIGR